ncbi:hypothetical protein GWO43_02295 [candidate division KSB1 bacterium]|nr:hypothetical protein [candidate division KSB1 bacterium]NIR69695.1 hypothetical protein [candidate division KSB1 bacterium]NIS24891.1 hypothetical protein [candidate division KSB1 bacterium]NIT69740.1 hypothetical protein [candidate division KSB1 bacterium]NIU23410.1 hypothetical protein [candidate division KSB1 bacterium]
MQKVLKNVADERLRAYVVWLPILQNDNRKAAVERTAEFNDKRVTHFWDKDRETGQVWQRILDIERLAWDVYFLYSSNSQWQKQPTSPYFWMHQLGGIRKGEFLDEEKFESKAKELLERLD